MMAGGPMGSTEVMAIFNETDALRQGHFVLTSGKHSAQYMQCAQVLQYPWLAAALGKALAARWAGVAVETVVGPAMGGILVAHEVGRALGVRALFAERQDGKMTLRRGFTLQPGEKVLVVEDVITTGGSVQEVIDLVKTMGAEPVGVGVLVDRSGGQVTFAGLPLRSLLSLTIEAFAPEECPLCARGISWEKPGSRGNV
ncbi:MAG: orotate phosphoribosyltransferase [Firmicutes bacterium]|nr:orotate phosphoribosyltransferase [Bacillota bacterium]